MSDTDYFSPERKKARSVERVRKYGMAIALILFFGISSYLRGDAGNLIAMKIAAVPLFVMALGFIPLQFNSEQARTPWTAAFIEMHALFGIVFASVMTIVGWQQDINSSIIVRNFLIMAVLWPAFMMITIHLVRKFFPND